MSINPQHLKKNACLRPCVAVRRCANQAACQPFQDTKNHGRIEFSILGAMGFYGDYL